MTSFWPLRPPNDEKKGSDFGEKARDRQLFIFHPKNDNMGDFNARTSTLSDVLPGDKDEDQFQTDFFSNIDTQRANQDRHINEHGRRLVEYCAATKSFIANGRTLGDLHGKFTCHEHNGSSAVDYAVVDESMADYVQTFQVLDPNRGSDHCAIKINIRLPSKVIFNTESKNIFWDDKSKISFKLRLRSQGTSDEINKTKRCTI